MTIQQPSHDESSFKRLFNFRLLFTCDNFSSFSSESFDLLSASPSVQQLDNLAQDFRKQLEQTINEVPLPEGFSAKKITNEIIKQSNYNIFSLTKKRRKKPLVLTEQDKELLKYIAFINKFYSRANILFQNDEEFTILIPFLETLQTIVQKVYEELLASISREQEKINYQFLTSDFPASYARIMNNALNILKTYVLYFLRVYPEFVKQLSEVFWEKTLPENSLEQQFPFIALQPLFNKYHNDLMCSHFKIELYINVWHAKSLKELVKGPKKNLSLSNLDKDYFSELLKSYEDLAEEFYSLLIEVAHTENKPLPFTLEDIETNKKEKLEFLSQIVSLY
ncbi:MAG: hypothetical protein GF308_18090 [Candidatus Heimdallarchaeota archaeon]|nr:hypothetical protein [Candidatus Heimdallarchaeota archaeon]